MYQLAGDPEQHTHGKPAALYGKRMNWNWPAGNNDYFPWYVILWHGLWYLPYLLARVLFVVVVGIYNGSPRLAFRAWDETR